MSAERRTEDHRRYQALLAAAVIDAGSLGPEEKRELEGHLERCPGCRSEETELRSVAAAVAAATAAAPGPPALDGAFVEGLRGGGADTNPPADPPADLEDRVVAAVLPGPAEGQTCGERGGAGRSGWNPRSLRTRSRIGATIGVFAVAVTVLVVVGVVPFVSSQQGPPGLGETEQVAFTGVPEGVSTEAAVVAHTWGTEVDLEVEGLEPGEVYAVNIEGRGGESVQAGTFVAVADDAVDCRLNGAVLRQNARGISVVDDQGHVVMRSELEPAPDIASIG